MDKTTILHKNVVWGLFDDKDFEVADLICYYSGGLLFGNLTQLRKMKAEGHVEMPVDELAMQSVQFVRYMLRHNNGSGEACTVVPHIWSTGRETNDTVVADGDADVGKGLRTYNADWVEAE